MSSKNKIKQGQFYQHDKGRCCHIVSKNKTFAFGEVWFIEEVDKAGHSVSVVETTTESLGENWTEIGEQEFLSYFKPRRKLN